MILLNKKTISKSGNLKHSYPKEENLEILSAINIIAWIRLTE
jgi:hypothetical protein